jgi:hypothetical protein
MHNELWLSEIDAELLRAEEAKTIGHEGRLRTCARRIAGIALREYSRTGKTELSPADDFIALLRECAGSHFFPPDIRSAAERLQARVTPEFSSPSRDPIADAMVIVAYVRSKD